MNNGLFSQHPGVYVSPLIPLTTALAYSVPHNLGSRHLRAEWRFVCLEPNNGYIAEDEVEVNGWGGFIATTRINPYSAALFPSSSLLGVSFTNTSGTAQFQPTAAQWALRCRVQTILP